MPFDFPDDMTLESYELYRPARPNPGHDPLAQGGERPPPGHDHDEDDGLNLKSQLALWALSHYAASPMQRL